MAVSMPVSTSLCFVMWQCVVCGKHCGTPGTDSGTVPFSINKYIQVGQKNGLFFRVNNFATVSGRNACDMSKFSKFYLEKNIKPAYQCVKYSLPNLHKYSMSLKLR